MIAYTHVNHITQQNIEIKQLKLELETERLRLAACGVVAMANTKDSRVKARTMKPEYWSASCEDVAKAVDREIDLREENARLRSLLSDFRGDVLFRIGTASPYRQVAQAYQERIKDALKGQQ